MSSAELLTKGVNKMKLTRDFYIDKKLDKVAEMLDHIVYYGKQGNFFVAQGFGGKRSKPDFYYLYKTEEGMLKKVISSISFGFVFIGIFQLLGTCAGK